MCHDELYHPKPLPPVGWHDVGHAAQAVALVILAVLIVSWFGHARRDYRQGIRRHEVVADVAVEPRALWGNETMTCEVIR